MPASRIDVALAQAREALDNFAAPRRQDRHVHDVLEALITAVQELADGREGVRSVRTARPSRKRKSAARGKPKASEPKAARDEPATSDEPSVLSA
jgi:hypothetical protein